MPFDQNDLPEWNASGTEPPQAHKDSGWGMSEHPPADWFNWLFNKAYSALQSLFDNAQHKEEKGKANGYASLDENGKIPAGQLNETAPADASLTAKGITKLNSDTNSTDETTAATPKAVKTVNDAVGQKYTKPSTGIPKTDLENAVQTSLGKADSALQSVPAATTSISGLVQLDSSLTTSTSKAPTSNAVLTAVNNATPFNSLMYWIQ
ncbi:tail fiber protein [Heyndrickxia acidicola]|uniref:Phage tail protein n=1 Tax=Heyndrickxia acidicola TaxID=209389 RepID=A0ABU6MBY6_9BACI|nr:phage tail protein [Heyndrickxia acidicola]MED1201939.1 phage tail protein [Heyndrickxia acidicola]